MGAGRGALLFPKSSTPHPSSAAARHVPSPAQLHLNTPLLPNTWLHLPLSKWKISIICLSEYPANEGFHDKLGGGLLCKGDDRTVRGAKIKKRVVMDRIFSGCDLEFGLFLVNYWTFTPSCYFVDQMEWNNISWIRHIWRLFRIHPSIFQHLSR